jgi:hypothetical protein
MLSALFNFFGLGFEKDVSQQLLSDILCEFVNVYVGSESGSVTHVASVSKRSAIARESGNGIK